MDKNNMKEWFVDMLWGKVALVSWGDPSNVPILMVHGYMDTAATFISLLNRLPNNFYYVGLDLPGHGKSDPFPPGIIISLLHTVEVIHKVIEYMKWDSFIFMAHSMGFIIGTFYQHFYPGKITKMIHLDPGVHISTYYYTHHKLDFWFQLTDTYYNNYERWNSKKLKSYTYDEAINLLVRNRSLTEEQAEVVLSRSLIPVGDGKFKLSFEQRMKKIINPALSEETLFTILTENIPPTLVVAASEQRSIPPARQFTEEILEKCKEIEPNYCFVTVSGGHDIHITNPDDVASHIVDFLKSDSTKNHVKSKL